MTTTRTETGFWEHVSLADASGCWLWNGPTVKGYGRFWTGETMTGSHRFAYEALVGPIPDGLVIDHLCRNRACCNPDHMEPVDNKTNILRGIGAPAENARKTHCKHGHEFTPENTYYYAKLGWRMCRECRRARYVPKVNPEVARLREALQHIGSLVDYWGNEGKPLGRFLREVEKTVNDALQEHE